MEAQFAEAAFHLREHSKRRFRQGAVLVGGGFRRGRLSVAVLEGHREAAAHQIAQVVGQVGIDPLDETLFAEARIEPEHHVPKQEIAEGIEAVFVLQVQGLDDVSQALGHLALVHVPVTVDVQVAVGFDPGRLEHRGPVDAVGLQDVLGDEVLGRGPEGPEVLPVGVARGGDVIDEGVEPDVGHVILVEGQRDPPGQPRLGAGNAEVLQGFAQEGEDLVPVAFRADEIGVVLDIPDEPLLVFAHAEEVVALLPVFRLGLVVRAAAVDELLLHVKPLATDAVVPLVVSEIDVSRVIHLPQDPADIFHMVRVGGPDEVIVGHGQLRPEGAELGADLIGVCFRGDAGLLRGFRDLVAVFVRSGHEKGPVSGQAVVAGKHVGDDRRVGMADMGRCVDVVDRGGDVVGSFHDRILSMRAGMLSLLPDPYNSLI